VKVVSYWLMQPVEGTFVPTAEVDELRWLSFGAAGRLLDYRHDRELLESVSIPPATATG
jgi:8-oxo-dGTP diphosphatase